MFSQSFPFPLIPSNKLVNLHINSDDTSVDVYHLIKHAILCQLLSIRANGLYRQLPSLIRSSSSCPSFFSLSISNHHNQDFNQDYHYTNRVLIDYLEQVLPSLCLDGRKNDERTICCIGHSCSFCSFHR